MLSACRHYDPSLDLDDEEAPQAETEIDYTKLTREELLEALATQTQ